MNVSGLPPSPPAPTRSDAPRPARPAAPGADATSGAPEAAHAGAPTLLDVLTPDERAFFTEQSSLGPLTYRPGHTAEPPRAAPTGRRIDVRG